jgi:hypothetical protein
VAGYAPLAESASNIVQRRTGYGLEIYSNAELPMYVDGNIYYRGSKPYGKETNSIYEPEYDPKLRIIEEGNNVTLNVTFGKSLKTLKCNLISTQNLGKAMIPDQAYENPDGSPLKIDSDFFGNKRNEKKPSAGPFENTAIGKELKLKVW